MLFMGGHWWHSSCLFVLFGMAFFSSYSVDPNLRKIPISFEIGQKVAVQISRKLLKQSRNNRHGKKYYKKDNDTKLINSNKDNMATG